MFSALGTFEKKGMIISNNKIKQRLWTSDKQIKQMKKKRENLKVSKRKDEKRKPNISSPNPYYRGE